MSNLIKMNFVVDYSNYLFFTKARIDEIINDINSQDFSKHINLNFKYVSHQIFFNIYLHENVFEDKNFRFLNDENYDYYNVNILEVISPKMLMMMMVNTELKKSVNNLYLSYKKPDILLTDVTQSGLKFILELNKMCHFLKEHYCILDVDIINIKLKKKQKKRYK